ncbi:hypothetical protein BT69DRAFT_445624 [Atractiella rhizophila]|nr:hypothetical protein BT69DRAFT_445624 [Atractiella rhizophila]
MSARPLSNSQPVSSRLNDDSPSTSKPSSSLPSPSKPFTSSFTQPIQLTSSFSRTENQERGIKRSSELVQGSALEQSQRKKSKKSNDREGEDPYAFLLQGHGKKKDGATMKEKEKEDGGKKEKGKEKEKKDLGKEAAKLQSTMQKTPLMPHVRSLLSQASMSRMADLLAASLLSLLPPIPLVLQAVSGDGAVEVA